MSEGDDETRWWACCALASFDSAEAKDLLASCLDSNDLAIQLCAAKGLQITPSVSALARLIQLLFHDDALLRRLAGDALASLEFEASAELIKVLDSQDDYARIEAARALSIIQDPASINALFGQINDSSSVVNYWAEEALNAMGLGMRFFAPST